MQKNKQTGGLTDEDLVQPGDETVLGSNNLIDTSKDVKVPEQENVLPEPETKLGQRFLPSGFGQMYREITSPITGGAKIYDGDFENYSKYIDRPFSMGEIDLDDTRAEGQGLGEKLVRSYGAQLPVGIVTNVLGSTVGLGVGLAEVINEGFKSGFSKDSTLGKFYDNDFQRSLDGINESVRETLPNYYTSQEAEYGAFKAAFGPGAANFWTDGMANGLAFVAGAVLSEYATAGLANALIPVKAANHLKRISALRNTSYGKTAAQGAKNLQKINRNEKIYSGLTTARRFMTGAMYESGVEARHNFDSTIDNLIKEHTKSKGAPPTEEEMLDIKQVAHATSNGVFAANAALVGYSNMLMFPRIFGKGIRASKRSLKNKFKKIKKDGLPSILPKYKDYNTFRKFGGGAYNALRVPMYEGFVEEGGQKLADIAGQKAAEQYYADGKNPNSLEALGGLLSNTWDSMGEAYGSPEGQKEIFLGFILGGLGLPSFVRTNKDTGKKEFGVGWQGGIKDSIESRIKKRKDLDDLSTYMNNNPEVLQAIKTNFDMAADQMNAEKNREHALLTDNNFAYKNAEHDAFFSHVYHRTKAGYFGDVIDGIKDIQNMDNDDFEEMFDYADKTENMSKDQRTEFLEGRKNKVAEQHIERANEIKNIFENTDSLNVGEDFKKAIVHAYSSAKDVDAREKMLIEELTNAGLDLSAETIDDVSDNDKKENEGLVQRLRNFTMSKLGIEAIDIMENSETGRKVKRELGIKEFTEPGHPVMVLQALVSEMQKLEEQQIALEAANKQDEAIDVAIEIEELNEKATDLTIAIEQGVASEISSEEQQVLDKFEKENPTEFLQNKEEYVEKLKDIRSLRALRHRMLNMVQQIIDPEAGADKRQLIEQYIEDVTQNEEYKGLSNYEKSLARKYRGKVVEFDYTKKDGSVKRYRAKYKNQTKNGLVVLPDEDVYKAIKSLEILNNKTNKTEEDKIAIDELNEKLKGAQKNLMTFDPSNTSLTNFKEIDDLTIQSENLQVALDVLQGDLIGRLDSLKTNISKTNVKLLEFGEQILQIQSAIQNARENKKGKLYVNLNAIGKKGNFSIEKARQLQAEILQEEQNHIEELREATEAVEAVTKYSEKLQVVYGVINNKETLGKNLSTEEAFEAISEILGIMSDEDFFKDLMDKGYFDNELRDIATTATKEGKEVDRKVVAELLNAFRGDNIPKEYIDIINNDLEEARKELKNLTAYRKELEKNFKYYDELISGQDFTEEDEKDLREDLANTEDRINSLTDRVSELSLITELYVKKDLKAIQEKVDNLSYGRELEGAIRNSLIEYLNWVESLMTTRATEVKDDTGKSSSGLDTNPENYSPTSFNEENTFTTSLLDIPFTKTAGNHQANRIAYNQYENRKTDGETLTPAEEMHYEYVMSQLRFFKASENLNNWTKKDGAKLMVITRNNIPESLKDKIIFYDSNKNDDPTSLEKYVYLEDYSGQVVIENEDMKLVLVDKNFKPIEIDGGIAYTGMPNNLVTRLDNEGKPVYKYNKDKDLAEDGSLKPMVAEIANQYAEDRIELFNQEKPVYYRIVKKSKALTIWGGETYEGDPGFRGSVIGRVVKKEQQIQNIDLQVAKSDKGAERAEINIGRNSWNVPNGFIYLAEPKSANKGVKGNLVRGIPQKLGESAQNNVYNLLRLFASRQEQVNLGQMNSEEASDIGGKGATTSLSEIIYFGKQAKDRKLKQYSIWLEKDAVNYGEKGKTISLEELQDPVKFKTKHDDFKEFLSTLYFNANSTRLGRDAKARTAAGKAKSKAVYAAKGKANKAIESKKPINYEYETHVEVTVNDNLEITTKDWSNYTEYLLSDLGRDISDVPVAVNMNLNINKASTPQFLNQYIVHDGIPRSEEAMKNDTKEDTEDTEETTEEEPAEVEVDENGEIINNEDTPFTDDDIQSASKVGDIKVTQPDGSFKIFKNVTYTEGSDISPVAVAPEDAEDEMGGSPFTSSNNPDADANAEEDAEDDNIFMLKSSVDLENSEIIDVDGQLEWFNANMPKDSNGNPLVGIELVKGLIDDKAFGKFTKDGNILLSDAMDVEGVLYHESWHAITRKLVSEEDRVKMYKEGKRLRGKARTFKGEVKKLSDFTDKEIDEWLAEEFRAYVIADGNYKVGQNVKKSWLDRLFDKMFNILNYFTNTSSNSQTLMSKIHGGYFTNPNTEITVYNNTDEAYMEGQVINPSLIQNTVEGMTVHLFHLAAKEELFEIEDIFNLTKKDVISTAVNNLYGGVGQKNKVYNKLLGALKTSEETQEKKLLKASAAEKKFIEKEILKIQETRGTIKNNWDFFIEEHKKFLERFKIEILDQSEIEENEKTGKGFDVAQTEKDPNLTLPHPVRLLLSTLPATKEINGKRQLVNNRSGFPKLADFGSTMAFLYKELANIDPKFIESELTEKLQYDRPELKMLVTRLGLETTDWSDRSFPQVRMIVKFLQQFNQANRKFYMQSIDRQGGRYLLDNNSNRIDNLVRDSWKLNFKKSILKGLGKNKNGKLIVNKDSKVTMGKVTKTFEEWVKVPKTAEQAVGLLGAVGIKYSDPSRFIEEYNSDDDLKDDVKWTLKEVVNNPISDLYEGNIQGRLKSLIAAEVAATNYAIDLIHINAAGKKVYGISLKNHLDRTAAELNNDPSKVTSLLNHHNLKNSVYLNSMQNDSRVMEIAVLEDIKQEFGRNRGLSKSKPSDIAVMHINAILDNGVMPFIRTADKKTEFAITFGVEPSLSLDRPEMIARLQGYLIDEIKTANIFNTNKSSKLRRIKTYADQGGDLRFFKGVVDISRSELNRKLSDNKILSMVQNKKIVKNLNEFLDAKIEGVTKSMFDLNVLRKGKEGSTYNVGINDQLVNKLKAMSGDVSVKTSELASSTVRVLGEQLTLEHMTGVIEQTKLFLGDLAQYKDLFKRTSGVSGTKIYPSSDQNLLDWMNENMPNVEMNSKHSKTMRTVTRADVEVDSPHLQEYIDIISVLNPKMLETLNENGENILEQTYNGMEEFDGGALVHFDSYRSLLFRAGKWTDNQETVYQKIQNDEAITNKDLAYFPALKPQVFAPFVEDNVRLMTFHKFALFPLIPKLMPGRTYDNINQDMVDNDIDYMLFNSVAKVGAVTVDGKNSDSFYESTGKYQDYKPMSLDSNGEPLGLLEFDFSEVGIQVEIAPKIKRNVSAGTQLTSLLPVNIYQNGEISEKYKDSGLESIIDEYHEVSYSMIKKDINQLIKKLGLLKQSDGRYLAKNMKKLSDEIMIELNKRDMPEHTKRGVKALFDSSNPFINQLFERDKIESILYSIATNSIIKRKMNGDMMVLQAATGIEATSRAIKEDEWRQANKENQAIANLKPLQFYRKGLDKNATPEQLANAKTLGMQVYLPNRFKDIIDINDGKLDKELLKLIGFRIPTEGLNSIDFIEVVGFLPASAGSSIVVPTEIVGKSGSDYDIDKLTMYFPNHTFNKNTGEYTKIAYLDNTNSSAKDRYNLMVEQNETKLSYDEFKKLSIPEQNIKKASQNRIQEIIRTVLEHPASFDQLITPVGAFELKDVANNIANLRKQRGESKAETENFHEMLSFDNMINKSYRMWSGLGGVGIVAVTSTGHAKAQRANLDWSPEFKEKELQLNFEGEGHSLSRINDVNDDMAISAILGQYVTGYVDVTKEDFVFDINAGVEYAPVHMMLIRSGVPLKQVAYFMSQPIIDDYVKLMETQRSLAADYSGSSSYLSKDDLVTNLKRKYGNIGLNTPMMLTAPILSEMIGKPVDNLEKMELRTQIQVLNDFLRYQEHADLLYLLNTAIKYDTSRLSGPTAIKYMKAALQRVQEKGAFVNIDNLLENDKASSKYSLLSGFKEGFDEGSKMFASADMKEFHKSISDWTYNKIYTLTDPELRRGEDEIGYLMKRFDSHLSSYIVQNTPIDGKLLHNKISKLFRGKNSLPRKILAAKDSTKLKDNLLIQEFYPILQAFEDPKNDEYFIDNMKLFSKKLQVFDVDLLADSYEEINEINPKLAKEILEFSVLQSGFHYSPNAFFQVLPSTRVLELISPYFDNYAEKFNLNLDNVWEDFMQNSVKDGKIVPRKRFYKNDDSLKSFINGVVNETSNDEYINMSAPTGTFKVIGSISKEQYETKLFKNQGKSEANSKLNRFVSIPIKGAGMNLIESGKDSMLKNNVSLGQSFPYETTKTISNKTIKSLSITKEEWERMTVEEKEHVIKCK